jgi:hypothetical protein
MVVVATLVYCRIVRIFHVDQMTGSKQGPKLDKNLNAIERVPFSALFAHRRIT